MTSCSDREMYEGVDVDFYEAKTRSRNPLQRWFHTNRYRIGLDLVQAKYFPGAHVADLGCGSCDWNLAGLNVTGVDLNENLLRRGKERGRLSAIRLARSSASGLRADSFDVVTSFEHLEHVHEYAAVIREGLRILKPGGYFIASVPYDVPLGLWQPLFFLQVLFQGYILGKEYYRKQCGHVNHFSIPGIRDAFVREGFEIEMLFHMRTFTIFLVARKPGPASLRDDYSDVTLILPTLNEEQGLRGILESLRMYPGISVIVTDDGSRDGTRAVAGGPWSNPVLFLDRQREPIHGLTASVLDAAERVQTPYFVVMDADGQHPASKIAEIVRTLKSGRDIVIASRIEVEREWGLLPKIFSYCGTAIGKSVLILRGKHDIAYDVLGGFFGIKTAFWRQVVPDEVKRSRFRLRGYKVLFDFLKYLPPNTKVHEVYYRFETRRAKRTKVNLAVYSEFLKSCLLP